MSNFKDKILNTNNSNDPLQAPDMTTAQIHAIVNPIDGMIVYNTDTRQLLTHAGGAWIAIGNTGSSGTVTSVDTGNGLTGGPITGAGIIGLENTAVTLGDYTNASITVDAQGRLTAASSGAQAVLTITGTAEEIAVDDTDPSSPVISLVDTTVTAGDYTNASITVDSQGRLTVANSGTQPVLTITGTAGQIAVDSIDVSTPVISLANTTVTPNSYGVANITVDAQGRLTSASSASPATTTLHSIITWGNTSGGVLTDNPMALIDSDGNLSTSGNIHASEINSNGNIIISKNGVLQLQTANSGTLQIEPASSLSLNATVTFGNNLTFPSDLGSAGQVLENDGTGVFSWVNSTDVVSGSYNLANVVIDANQRVATITSAAPATTTLNQIVTWGSLDGSSLSAATTPVLINDTGDISNINSVSIASPSSSGGSSTGSFVIEAPTDLAADITWTLPQDDGVGGQFLSDDGSGILSWASAVTSISSPTGTITVGTGLNPTIDLSNTTVLPGDYTNASVSVDAQGRLIAASSGVNPVTGISGTAGNITVTGTTTPIINLATTGITAQTYAFPKSITFDAFGRATAVVASAPSIATFTTSGTWTIPAGITAAKVTVVGGGGGGGGTAAAGLACAQGGGGGGYATKVLTGLIPGNTISYTVGAAGTGGAAGSNAGTVGGTTSFSTLSATGGAAGGGGATTGFALGGVGSGGTLNLSGGHGSPRTAASTTAAAGSFGGNSFYGYGGTTAPSGTSTAGQAPSANSYGAGGSGAFVVTAGVAAAGGNGSVGIIIIEY